LCFVIINHEELLELIDTHQFVLRNFLLAHVHK
jgi:hypothetical protein